jgi:tetratricopeptide (TPR) repeat protein
MANQENETIVDVEKVYSRTEKFYEDNKKNINVFGTVILAAVVIYLAFVNFYQKPRELEASESMWKAEYYFEIDSLNLAINGDGNYPGFAQIASDFSGTKSANLANYYMGIASYRLGDYTGAIAYLKDANLDDDMVSSVALGTIGDAYVELEQFQNGVDYFGKAVANSDNEFTAPIYMKKQAILLENLGEYAKALDIYKSIKSKYPTSAEGQDMERYIARAEGLSK